MQNQYRHELKYLISQGQLAILQQRLDSIIPRDSHTGSEGIYQIRSVYFDDFFNTCYLENIAGTDPREKFRIRIYNCSEKRIQLECKRKERGKTQKNGCLLTLDDYHRLMTGQLPPASVPYPPVLRKFTTQMLQRGMQPKVIVNYERIPFVYLLGNVRITLDMNISSASNFDAFFDPALHTRPVLPYGQHLLEVKYDDYLPDFIYHALQTDNLQQTAFSKYALCRRYHL